MEAGFENENAHARLRHLGSRRWPEVEDRCHPDQEGSASLKTVMRPLAGRGHEDLAIADGETADLRFLEMAFGRVDDDERAGIVKALEECCGLDTEGMIEIVERLKGQV